MDDNITPQSAAISSVQDDSSQESLVFNIGGVTFETYRSTLLRIPTSPLANTDFLEEHYRPEREDYFFDRDPDAFKVVLDFLRTGQLCIPWYIDRPSLRNDLLFWGLTPSAIPQTESASPAQHQGVNSGIAVLHPADLTRTAIQETTNMKIWNILSNPETSIFAKLYAALTYLLIFASILIMVFETTTLFHKNRGYNVAKATDNVYDLYVVEDDVTYSESKSKNHKSIYFIILGITIFFTAEYICRLVVAPNRLRFVFSFLGVIDFLAILPDYAGLISLLFMFEGFFATLLYALSAFRVLRALRVFKHFGDLMKTDVFVRTFKASAGELVFVGSLYVIGTLVSATVCYVIETASDSSEYSHFRNIPDACYWAIITITTVGYGDMRPISLQGKVFAAFTALFGLVMIGFLVSALTHNFIECSMHVQSQSESKTAAYQCTGSDVTECRPLTAPPSGDQNT